MFAPNGTAKMQSSLAGLTLLRPGIRVVKFFFRTEPSAFPTAPPSDRKQHLAH
jgi:hypothetical protein